MSENKSAVDKRVLLGGILIFFGGLFLLNTMNILHFRIAHVLFSFPFFMFVIGLFVLVNTEKKFLGGILAGIGILFPGNRTEHANADDAKLSLFEIPKSGQDA